MLSGHLTFQTLQQLLLQRRLLQKVAEITPAIQGIIHAIMKESQRADQTVIEIRMTHIVNEDSVGIYIHWEINEKEKEGGRKTSHKKLRSSFSNYCPTVI